MFEESDDMRKCVWTAAFDPALCWLRNNDCPLSLRQGFVGTLRKKGDSLCKGAVNSRRKVEGRVNLMKTFVC